MTLQTHPSSSPTASIPPSPFVRHTAIFLPLFAPFGISSGYVSVTLAFLLGRAGLSAIQITTIIAATLWAQTWKVLWAPIIDTAGGPKLWYALGAAMMVVIWIALSPARPRRKASVTLT